MKFLFDLGGVFFDWNPRFFFKNIIEDSNKLNFFLTKVCNDEWNIKQDAGRSVKEAEEDLIKKYPNYSTYIKLYYLNHHKMIIKTFDSSIMALKELKKNKISCFALSNWSSETFVGMLEEFPFLDDFDDIIISGDVKLVKPDAKIYNLAIKKFSLIPENTVFIDDKIENIQAAEKLEFKTIHLTDPFKIYEEIKRYLNF